MVLESIFSAFSAERKPWKMFFMGFLYSSLAMWLALWIFKSHASLVMVFLTVLAAVPLMYSTIVLEEEKDMKGGSEKVLLKEHGKALSFFVFLFLGCTLAFTFWYVALPADLTLQLFSVQTQTIADINTPVTGNAINSAAFFSRIFFNNLKVLIFCLIFSFLYGSGAIFILTWNASVIGAAIGNFIRSNITAGAGFFRYFEISSLGLFRYFIHGIPEILGYFVGGLAAGIISIAVIRHDFTSSRFSAIVTDAGDLVALAIGILFIAALIEVFITPVLF